MSRAICLFYLFAGLAGCGQPSTSLDPELVAKQRAQLTLAEEPDEAVDVSAVREALLGEESGHAHAQEPAIAKATEPIDVALVGRIGGLANPWQETQPDFPFARNQAAFFLADLHAVAENEEGEHAHASGEACAFCEAHAEDRSAMLAMVRFLDKNGDVLRIDVRELFDVKEQATVVVRGTARVVEGGMLVVDATGLYVRR